ncbi:peptidoglycan recognition family protein [Nodularia spumigena CS-591/12]|uniref:peptidoglycan recognition protein family protein n=1 Tax=Nodularia spumigena TaxID=70799 RepID=UPI00232E5AE9|nr:peptidoglycan recognition family protein [Nodularia spumigena]MDB9306463.1 peptidoglycan recognition family protein [Nodularia spumigena CS-591/12]MDB9348905.1 peptidoglycan recognition family protein [Nodularia spumigena CS-588/01]MDB9351094.1 peptidoglycan recognition family protein [Nodularia spumigena CS-588/05]
MKFTDWATRILLISLMLTTLMIVLSLGRIQSNKITSNPENADITIDWNQYPQAELQSAKNPKEEPPKDLPAPSVTTNQNSGRYRTTEAFAKYTPRYEIAPVNPSNYGERYSQDVNGLPLNNQPIIVLHETAESAASAVNFFQTHNADDNVQASYHALIQLDGTIVYLVPPDKRAYGAANSVFESPNGVETVTTNPNLASSVNNFAYHVSLETPPDGRGNNLLKSHSGYTELQYNSLAWLIAQSQVPDYRITTHEAVDRSGQKSDPISFDGNKFLRLLHTYRELTPSYQAQN